MSQIGLVVACHGRHVMVETESGERVLCHPKSKKNSALVGDRVRWSISGDEGSIDGIEVRRNLLYRQDEMRTKLFAANLDQVLLMLAAEPEFSEDQLSRSLIACSQAGIETLIVLNKSDLQPQFSQAWVRLEAFRNMGLTVLPLSLKSSPDGLPAIDAQLAGRKTLLLGPSGVGKSSFINRVVPRAKAQTAELSLSSKSGRHTTTHNSLYWIDRAAGSAVVDSPGFQSFGLHHLSSIGLVQNMPDINRYGDHCRFRNCAHLHEPDCSVRAALAAGLIDAQRYRLYQQLMLELSAR